ncbi:MAG: endolytic transglycosylase MltG [Alphaproteobacteria bacterium]|nr:endolytic transglycosylase MltG [Alphaproteobacteria bacterium]
MSRRPLRRAPRRRAHRRGAGAWLGLILILLLLAAGALAALVLLPGPGRRDAPARTVILNHGQGVLGIGQALQSAGLVRSGLVFAAAAEASGAAGSLKAGEYAFSPHESLLRILDAIRHGRVVRRFVTVPEGLTSADAAAILMRVDVLTGPAPVAPEGALLPETYEVQRGESRADVIARMRQARDALLARLWATRAPNLPYADPEQAVVLASVVEKETALGVERPLVAAVFVNRLRTGMRLDSDPTVIYGLTHGAPLGHGLTRAELDRYTAYNTYRIAGLPPTPIDNPGRAALTAALNPAQSHALYFVANGAGGHAFADTLSDHARNVMRWRQIESSAHGRAPQPTPKSATR